MLSGLVATFSDWTIQEQHIENPQITTISIHLIDCLLMTLMNTVRCITLPLVLSKIQGFKTYSTTSLFTLFSQPSS
jgi:hypothetical protein